MIVLTCVAGIIHVWATAAVLFVFDVVTVCFHLVVVHVSNIIMCERLWWCLFEFMSVCQF